MSDTAGWRTGLLLLAASVLTAAVLWFAAWGPLPLRVEDWVWFRIAEPPWESALAPLGVYALIGLVAILAWQRAERLGRAKQALVISTLTALALLGQLLAAKQLPGDYNESIVALATPGANRYHSAARDVKDLGWVLRDYPSWMSRPDHRLIVTHPAGPLTLFWRLNQVFAGSEDAAQAFVRRCEDLLSGGVHVRDPEAPRDVRALLGRMAAADLAGAWLASFVLRLAASLVVPAVFAAARAMYGLRAGLVAAALSAVVPSLLLFSPGLDPAFPALAATACWLGWSAGARNSPWGAAMAGAVLSLGLFFSLSFAVVAVWAGLLCLAALRRAQAPRRAGDAEILALSALAGLAVPAITLYLAVGYNSPAVWWKCLEANAAFNARSGRGYWTWLGANPVEFLVFVGVPVACLFVARVASAGRDLWRRRAWREADWPTLIVAGLLVALNVLGANRGEVARLWMFLMPGCVIAAAAQAERCAPYRRAAIVAVFALQAIQATVFKSLLDVLSGMYRGLG
ncbi:MAG: hypothetical protein FJ291_32625 [Planctomycetes bacterium]|nr:hypothetical protein [Planctomycetota bacterium]